MLTKDEILALDDRKFEDVQIPEWDTAVRIAEFGADMKDEFDQYLVELNKSKKNNRIHIMGAVAAASMVDEKGIHIFTMDDAPALGKKSGKALERIFAVSNRLNKIFGKEREETKKNSKATGSD